MTILSRDLLLSLLAEAQLAPSVHNVQPSRWRAEGDRLTLLGDLRRTIPVADPSGRDWRLSHGAHLEGLAIALSRRGLQIVDLRPAGRDATDGSGLLPIASLTVVPGGSATGLPPVQSRATWRGVFRDLDPQANEAVARLGSTRNDCVVVADRHEIGAIAALFDEASLHFLRQDAHRRELLDWMRLSKRHPGYAFDGLNAESMSMSPIEAWGAGLVLGPLFHALDALGLAASLTSEATKTRSAAAIGILHRPDGEDPLETGRHFYGAWLDFERAGLKACPMSVLSDWGVSRERLSARHGVAAGRSIAGVFRLGVANGTPTIRRFRLPVERLLV